MKRCWFCKQRQRGSASGWVRDEGMVDLCHDGGRDCYHLVTVYQLASPEEATAMIDRGADYLRQYWDGGK